MKLPHQESQYISLSLITISPLNYRGKSGLVNEESLKELAESIKIHGVIQPVLIRAIPEGKYELVVGERRFRASKIVGTKVIPSIICNLSDEEVQEIQIIENLQREDPHPMAEALGIQQLLSLKDNKNTVDDIAKRICKSVAYVYQRIKLCNLTENFREMFFVNKINISQALKIARLDAGSQEDFYNANCKDWKEEDWMVHNFNGRIENYQLDLDDAPFNIKDAKLDKKAGACTKCPNNTAVTTSLFPDDSKDARCTNRPCYENKCRLFAILNIATILKENPELPIAVKDESVLAVYFSANDDLIKGRTILVEDVDFDYYDEMEEKPDRKDFTDYEDDDENETEYQEALSEYETELQRMEDEATAGNYRKAILISETDFGTVVYLYEKGAESDTQTATRNTISSNVTEYKAKDYQEAVKTKTLTLEMINGEKDRLNKREERSKELDQIKLQENFYEALKNSNAVKSAETPAGTNDRAVAIFLMYDSLGWYGKQEFNKAFFDAGKETHDEHEDTIAGTRDEQLIHFFFNATENQVSLLTRLALLNKSDAKSPDGVCGQMLRLMVEYTPGLDAAELVSIQRTVTKERENKLSEKLAVLDKQAEKLS